MTDIEKQALALVKVCDLHELLSYDPETGILIWRKRDLKWFKSKRDCDAWNTRYAGKITNYIHKFGYVVVRLQGRRVRAHQIAYAMATGEWPKLQIDHINGDRADNRIANLRHVDHATNCKNTKRHKHNTSGTSGVYWHRRDRKWVARIGTTKAGSFIGSFTDLNKAVQARKAAEIKLGYHPNHGRTVEAPISAALAARNLEIVEKKP